MSPFVAIALSAAVWSASVTIVHATEPPDAERETVEAFGLKANCGEWTDGCVVCLRRDDGTFGCSLPGIACQPHAIACKVQPRTPATPRN